MSSASQNSGAAADAAVVNPHSSLASTPAAASSTLSPSTATAVNGTVSSSPAALTPIPASSTAASSSSSSITDSTPVPDLSTFLSDLSRVEREAELQRVLKAFKLNPLDILNLSHAHSFPSSSDVSRAYRQSSLLIHPDKFPPGPMREKAQNAFAMLAQAKEALGDEAKREDIEGLIDKARQRVLTDRAAEGGGKRQKVNGSSGSGGDGSTTAVTSTDPSVDPQFDQWVRAEVKELLIDREWRKRQLLKAAAEAEKAAKEEKEKRAAEKAARDAEKAEWEAGREKRINSWRDFQKGGMKSKFKMPKRYKEDEQHSFVRRAVGAAETTGTRLGGAGAAAQNQER